MTTDLSNPTNGTLTEQCQDFVHGGQISPEFIAESAGSRRSCCSVALVAEGSGFAWMTPECHGFRRFSTIGTISSGRTVKDPWLLLRKRHAGSLPWGLRLIVHGRAGGEVPDCLRTLAQEVERRRGVPAQIEALTAEESPDPELRRNWLVPLLLLPGSHARDDVPVIRQRLQAQGVKICGLPFLGSWPAWWLLLQQVIRQQDRSLGEPVLVHHPLRCGFGDRFLARLEQQLGIPTVSADDWQTFQSSADWPCQPLPLALAPNRMTEALQGAGGLPPLLEIEAVRAGLIDLLTALP